MKTEKDMKTKIFEITSQERTIDRIAGTQEQAETFRGLVWDVNHTKMQVYKPLDLNNMEIESDAGKDRFTITVRHQGDFVFGVDGDGIDTVLYTDEDLEGDLKAFENDSELKIDLKNLFIFPQIKELFYCENCDNKKHYKSQESHDPYSPEKWFECECENAPLNSFVM